MKIRKTTESRVKEIISAQTGVDITDISTETSFVVDLKMNEIDLSDLVDRLKANGFETKEVEINELEFVGELIEILRTEVELA